jgi:orotidine-5'-phosphate decarboxylase
MMADPVTIEPRVIVALDYSDAKSALALVEQLDPQRAKVKIGKELFTAAGPGLLRELVQRGYQVFLDLKYHDIPNTVAGACRAAAGLGVWMINVHALGGRAMMEAARAALVDHPATRLIAVTLLTSMNRADMVDVGLMGEPLDAVLRLARLAQSCGLDGVVCSAAEARAVRVACGERFCLVTPGIRPAASEDDQKRVMTPRSAIEQGASYLVIGRPITRASDPAAALEQINREIGKGDSL